MPANLKDLRTRIKSVRNTEQITKAMKLVSTAKFGRAQGAVMQSKPYARALSRVARNLVAALGDGAEHPLISASESNLVTVVVLSSERGLCGSFNSGVAKLTIKTVEELRGQGRDVAVVCIGKKAYASLSKYMRAKGMELFQNSLEDLEKNSDVLARKNSVTLLTTPFEKRITQYADALCESFQEAYAAVKTGRLLFVYTKFESAGSLPLGVETLVPMTRSANEKEKLSEPIYEPNANELLDAVIPRYLAMNIRQVLLESVASEHCARMGAMENATRNAREMMRKLQITYQRARQAAITRELIEIISGAEAI
jgi:F-type H+-transporting ATPase subunit gamma